MDKNDEITISYFENTFKYYQFIVLKKISELQEIDLPIDTEDAELLKALTFVHIQNLINDKLIEKYPKGNSVCLQLTKAGELALKKHYIDYQLDLLKLENILGNFFCDLVGKLKEENIQNVALYGASDTTFSIYRYLTNNNIKVACVLDDDKRKHGQRIYDSEVVDPKNIDKYTVDALIISTVQYQEELYKRVKGSKGNKYKIVKLFN